MRDRISRTLGPSIDTLLSLTIEEALVRQLLSTLPVHQTMVRVHMMVKEGGGRTK